MAQLTKAAFLSKYLSLFADNATRDISEADLRDFRLDISDSFLSLDDNFIDEDSFASNSATKVPSQQSAKAYVDAQTVNDTDIKYYEQFDWILSVVSASNNLPMGWAVVLVGANATWSITQYGSDATENAVGAIELVTGTTSTGMSVVAKGGASFSMGRGNTLKFRIRSALKTLSNATDRYTVYQGFGESVASSEHTDGAYFRYSDDVNAGKWQAVTRKDGVETATDTGVTADVLFSIFDIRVNSDATSVTFYINSVLVATHTTNIPSGAADYIGLNFKILKSVGTANSYFVMDWYDFLLTRTTAR